MPGDRYRSGESFAPALSEKDPVGVLAPPRGLEYLPLRERCLGPDGARLGRAGSDAAARLAFMPPRHAQAHASTAALCHRRAPFRGGAAPAA